MPPEHVLQDREPRLDLSQIDAGLETVRGDLLGRGDDRPGVPLMHAPLDQLEQPLHVTAALRRAERAGLIAPAERGQRLIDHLVLDVSERGRYLR